MQTVHKGGWCECGAWHNPVRSEFVGQPLTVHDGPDQAAELGVMRYRFKRFFKDRRFWIFFVPATNVVAAFVFGNTRAWSVWLCLQLAVVILGFSVRLMIQHPPFGSRGDHDA
jgi:hypothetical protein